MKILMLSHYFHPHLGGVEKHLAKLSQELIKNGHEITILTSQHQPDLPLQKTMSGVKVVRLPLKKVKFFGLLHLWWQLLKKLTWLRQFELIHIHDVFIWFLPIRFLLPFKPIFMTFHGYVSSPVKLKEKFFYWLAEKLTRGNICIGDFIPQHFKIKADTISYGAAAINQDAGGQVEPGHQTSEKYNALFIGRLSQDLGLPIYLAAIKQLQQKNKFEVLFLGDGPWRQEAEQVGTCQGWVDQVELFFDQTQVVFAASYLSILEAMQAGKLVFAAHAAADDLKRDCLQLAPFSRWITLVDNAQDLVKKIEFYQAHPQQAQSKIETAQAWAQNQTWAQLAKTYQELWSSKF